MTDKLVELARMEARHRGMPGLALAVIAHPLAGISEAELAQRTEAAVVAVRAGIFGG